MAQTIWWDTPTSTDIAIDPLYIGDIIFVNVLGKNVVFLNSEKVATDLLDKRSIIYSDRPYFPVHEM